MGLKQIEAMKRISRWCIVKSAVVKDDRGRKVDVFTFGKQAWVVQEKGNKLFVLFSGSDWKGKKQGWVNRNAMASHPVEDYASLFYTNNTGKRIPVAIRYCGSAYDYLPNGTTVSVKAKVGEWCLTNKGWTLFKWLTKEPGNFWDENVNALGNAVLLQAAKDYKIAIAKIRMGRYRDPEEYAKAFGRVDEITRWFTGRQYGLLFGYDDGKEKLDWLNETLGVDKKWLAEKRRIYEELQSKNMIRRRRSY